MVTGKRKKYTMEERKILMQEQMKKRNEHEEKVLSTGRNGYKKIFLLSKEQMKQYEPFYNFAEQLYENTSVSLSTNSSQLYTQSPANSQFQYFYKSYYEDITSCSTANTSHAVTNSSRYNKTKKSELGNSKIYKEQIYHSKEQ